MTAPTGTAVAAPIIRVFQVVRKWRVARAPARASRRGKRQPVGREFGPRHVRGIAIDAISRPRSAARRPARRSAARCKPNSIRHGRGGRSGRSARHRDAALPWQMTAPASGSEAAMLAAQHAPIGAKICTARAIRTMGRKFFSRRIANPSASELNHPESPKSRSGSRNYVAASRSKPGEKRCILAAFGMAPYLEYQASGVLRLNPQPSVANSQSFRRLLEF